MKLSAFEGPLDLLLQLVQARKLDVSLVSLAAITSDYVAHVHAMRGVPANDLASFLVVAAQLVAVKSRLLLPSTRGDDRDHEPDGEELLRRVQAYERYKEAAERLAERLGRELESYAPRVPQPTRPPPMIDLDLPGVSRLRDLIENLARPAKGSVATAPAVVARAWVEVDACMEILRELVVEQEYVRFSSLVVAPSSADRTVGLFLALLHLWRRGEIDVAQDGAYADIRIAGRAPRPYDASPE